MNIKNLKSMENTLPLISYSIVNDEKSINVSHKNLLFVLTYLKKHINCQYNLFTCVLGIDILNTSSILLLANKTLSVVFNSRNRVKIFVNEVTLVESAVPLFKNSNWWEREVWDLYGVYFQNHPDLRRILTDYGFEGYPMRKDFPLSGYVEVRYDSSKKKVVVEPIELAQEFRSFTYETPWLSEN